MKIKYLSLFLVSFSMYCAEWSVFFTYVPDSEEFIVSSETWFEEVSGIGFHLLKVPEGYTGDTSLDFTPDNWTKLNAMLQSRIKDDISLDFTPDGCAKLNTILQKNIFKNMFIVDKTETKTPKKINADSFRFVLKFKRMALVSSFKKVISFDPTIVITNAKGDSYKKNTKDLTPQ